ncbi:MAG: hypothetical protein U1E88_05350 [Acinetobacter sp.]
MASKVSDWKALIGAMWDGAKGSCYWQGKGPWGMLFGGLIGAGIGGFTEWKRQAARHQEDVPIPKEYGNMKPKSMLILND